MRRCPVVESVATVHKNRQGRYVEAERVEAHETVGHLGALEHGALGKLRPAGGVERLGRGDDPGVGEVRRQLDREAGLAGRQVLALDRRERHGAAAAVVVHADGRRNGRHGLEEEAREREPHDRAQPAAERGWTHGISHKESGWRIGRSNGLTDGNYTMARPRCILPGRRASSWSSRKSKTGVTWADRLHPCGVACACTVAAGLLLATRTSEACEGAGPARHVVVAGAASDTLAFGLDEVVPVAISELEKDDWTIQRADSTAGSHRLVTRWKPLKHALARVLLDGVMARCVIDLVSADDGRTVVTIQGGLTSTDDLENRPRVPARPDDLPAGRRALAQPGRSLARGPRTPLTGSPLIL